MLSSMTGDEFRSRFQVGERLTQPPVVTHRATDDAGVFVLVHYLLGSESVSSASLLAKVHGVSPDLSGKIRDLLQVDGLSVVVTDLLPDFTTLEEWLASGAEVQADPVEPESPVEEEPKEPGAYTQLFRLSEMGLDGTDGGSGEKAGAPKPTATPSETKPPEGHSTQGAGTPTVDPVRPQVDPVAAPTADPTSPPPDEKKAPGSYTMLFGKGALEGPPKESQPTPPAPEPAPPPPPETPEQAAPEPPVPPPAPPEEKAPGSYTMLFGGGVTEPPASVEGPPMGKGSDPAPRPSAPPPPPPPPVDVKPAPPKLPDPPLPEVGEPSLPEPTPPGVDGIQETPLPPPIQEAKGGASPTPPPPPVEKAAPPSDPGSATGFLGQVEEGDDTTSADPLEPVFPSLEPPAPTQPPPPPPLAPPVAPGGEPHQVTGSGGETEAPVSPPPASGKKDDGKPGAYTQIFGAMGPAGTKPPATPAYPPPSPSPTPTPPPAPRPSPPSGREGEGPGWQRWKDTPGAAGEHIPGDDYLSRLSGAPTPGHGPPPPSAPPPPPTDGPILSAPPPPGGPPGPAGPGHYTMVREGLNTGPGLGGPPPPTTTGTPPPPDLDTELMAQKSTKSKLLPILGLVFVLLSIVALVVVLALTS